MPSARPPTEALNLLLAPISFVSTFVALGLVVLNAAAVSLARTIYPDAARRAAQGGRDELGRWYTREILVGLSNCLFALADRVWAWSVRVGGRPPVPGFAFGPGPK